MNALQGETSPYLLQHAANPVEWYPWGPEALAKAHRENKPILLSIGYSACHWCHVMAHESFEDQATAELMNSLFINIKVDREERPDIDKIYQTAQYLLTQNQGGWPLTMFLTPNDQVPFLGGTYFPKEAAHGLPAFKDLLTRTADTYREREVDIREQNTQVIEALKQIQNVTTPNINKINDGPIDATREQAARTFDHHLGGFGRAPKFPHPTLLERLMRDYSRSDSQDEDAWYMACHTLTRMANGGIYDQLGGGFCRYSVDNQWMIPHFEKMLYDNGQLLTLYAQAWLINHDPLFEKVVEETAAWVIREMTSPDGGFYSSLDADSEGTEGAFYIWEKHEVEALIGDDFEAFARRFGLNGDPNFGGRWHLRIVADYQEIANVLGSTAEILKKRINSARTLLFDRRETRIHPHRDEKILTSWNALMIKGFAIAGNVFARDDYLDTAEHAIDFIRRKLWRNNKLLATCKDDHAHLNAYLDDYAFLIDALLHQLSARWRHSDLCFAIELADYLIENFEDQDRGGFYFTAHSHESLIHRTKPLSDDALPAGNGIAAWSIARLGHLLGESRYLRASTRTLHAALGSIENAPGAHNALLLALEENLNPPTSVVLRGERTAMLSWKRRLEEVYDPARLCFAIPDDNEKLPSFLARQSRLGKVTAYVCYGPRCLPPIKTFAELVEILKNTKDRVT